MTSILICDDHPVVRRGLATIVTAEVGAKHVGEAATAQQALDAVRQRRWDLVLLDITLPGKNGLELLKELKHERPDLPVLVVSMHPEDQYAVRTLRAGASGYLTKETAPDELVAAVRAALHGRPYVSPHVAERLVNELGVSSDRPPHDALSDRELEVICLIGAGKGAKEIGRALSLSIKTVSTYRTRGLHKLGLRSNADIIRYVIEQRLIESAPPAPNTRDAVVNRRARTRRGAR